MLSGLPVGVAAFVGREHERAHLAGLLASARVVTLVGSGGCGKTRLAVEVAGDVAPRFADGVRWVDLQGVTDHASVPAALGDAVGVHERPGQAITDTLVEALRTREVLVVLDNCEHLVEACATLVGALSRACPRLHVLGTSRVPLSVGGEATFEVGPLPVPRSGAGSASAVASAEAARLFELRARQVTGDFRIDDDNAAAVAEVCRRLDGIPLAIELAAARTRALAPGQIAAGLSDRFRLLTGGRRGAPARQRTLEASLDWSHELLDDAQRLALARLSVFAGSFELDAAEGVLAGEEHDSGDVLDLVSGLVDQSLVQVVQRRGSARYRLLETIRTYARERLGALDDVDRTRDRHLAFHVGLAGEARAGLIRGQPAHWVTRLSADLDDLRAAMEWAAESAQLQALVDITEPIVRFWFERGLSRELDRRLQDAADTPGAPVGERVRALLAAAALALAGNEPASAHRSAGRAVDLARGADLVPALAVALGQRGYAGARSGLASGEQVDADVAESLHHAQRAGDASTHAYVLAFAGGARFCGSSLDTGCLLFERAVEVCEANDLAFQLAAVHASLGAGLGPGPEWSGRLDRTRRHARRAAELGGELGRPGWEAIGLIGLGAADLLQGDQGGAREWLSRAQSVVRSGGLEGSQYDLALHHWLALSAYACGDGGAARTTAEEIARTGRAGGSRLDEAVGEWLLGVLALGQGLRADARAHLEASRGLSAEPRIPWPLGRSLLGLAELAQEDDHLEDAWDLAHDALEVLDAYGDRVGTAMALEGIAGLAVAHGEPERSLRLLAASERFHTDTGTTRFPGQDERFARVRTAALAGLADAGATGCTDAGGGLSLADAVSYARRGRGVRGRPSTGWASLTPVERDVVRLVAGGLSNAAIGRRLFISVNTVKKHLSHVYAKVDVDGRADLAAQVARREL